MLRWVIIVGGLFALGARAAPQQSRPRVSANGLYTIRFTEHAPGKCLLEIAKEEGPTFQLGECVGTVDDLFFVANDGQRFWVLRTVPRVPQGRKFHQHPERWGKVVVAVLYGRDGKVVHTRRLEDFIGRHEVEKVADLGLRFGWLAGVNGATGVTPHLTDAGVVELETVAGKQYRLGF